MLEVTYDLIQLLNVLLALCGESDKNIISRSTLKTLLICYRLCQSAQDSGFAEKFTTATEWDISQLPHEQNRAK